MTTIRRFALFAWTVLALSQAKAIDRIDLPEQLDPSLMPYAIGADYVLDEENRKVPIADPFQVVEVSRPGGGPGLMSYVCNGDLSREMPAAFHFSRPDDFKVLQQLPVVGTVSSCGVYYDRLADETAIVATCYRNDSAFAIRIRPSGDGPDLVYLASGQDKSGDDRWEGLTHICLVSDYDLDGRTEAFLHVGPGYDLEPRVLVCLELETLHIEWKLPVASLVWRGNVFAVPDSLDPAVVFVSYNPCNGTEDANFFDCLCYLTRVNGRGEITYNKVISIEHGSRGLWTGPSDTLFYLFHALPCLDVEQLNDTLEPHYQLSLIDAHCASLRTIDLPDRLNNVWRADYDGDGTPDIYTLSTGGIVRVYDSSYALVAESDHTGLRNFLGEYPIVGRSSPVFFFNTAQATELLTPQLSRLAHFDRVVDYVQPLGYDEREHVTRVVGAHFNASYVLSIDARPWMEMARAYVWAYREMLAVMLICLLLLILVLGYLRIRALRRLNESETRYRTLVEGAGEAIFLVDHGGVFILINEVAARHLGRTVADCIGKTMWQLFPKEVADRQMAAIIGVLDSGEPHDSDSVLELPGGVHHYRTSLRLVTEAGGSARYVLGIAKDITDLHRARKQLESERDFVKSLIRTANSLIFCLDKDARLTTFNDECVRVTGYSREEALGKRWPDLCMRPEDRHPGLDDFGAWVKAHPSDSYESTIITKSGEERIILWSNSAVFGDDGNDLTAIAVGVDITERKKAEQGLRGWNVFSKALIQESPLGISVRNCHGQLLTANKAWQSIWAVSDELLAEYKARRPQELRFDDHDSYLGDYLPEVERVYRQGGHLHVPELRLFSRRHAHIRWVSQYFYAITDADDAVDRVVVVTEDITARKRAEEGIASKAKELAESEEQFRQLAEMAPVCIVIYQGTRITYANPEMLKIYGVAADQLSGVDVFAPFSDEFRNDVHKHVLGIQQGAIPPQDYETRIITSTGEERWLLLKGGVMHYKGQPATLGIGIDITEQKRGATALRDSEAKYRRIVEALFDAIIACDQYGRILYVTPSLERILGYNQEEIVGRSVLEFLAESQIESYQERLQRVLVGRTIDQIELTVYRADGTSVIVQTHTVPVFENGFVIGTQSTWRDVTRQREAETALRESEEKFRLIAEGSHDMMFLTDLEGRVLYASPSVTRFSKHKADDLIGRHVGQFVPEVDLPQIEATVRSVAAGRSVEGMRCGYTRRDGSAGMVEINCSPLLEGGKPVGVVAIARDMTERQLTEKRLEQARRQRYQHIRQIAGGLAHEVYNSLYPVTASLHKLKTWLAESPPDKTEREKRLLDLSQKAVGRALALTELVNVYARLDEPASNNLTPVAHVIEEVFEENRRRLGKQGVKVALDLDAASTMSCHREHIYSVVNNLLMNAMDALTDRPVKLISVEFKADHNGRQLIFSDTGHGIAPDILPRIFDPFFTTRPRAGTGMGLALVQRVVEICGGHIAVKSAVGNGTTFTIFFPEVGTM